MRNLSLAQWMLKNQIGYPVISLEKGIDRALEHQAKEAGNFTHRIKN